MSYVQNISRNSSLVIITLYLDPWQMIKSRQCLKTVMSFKLQKGRHCLRHASGWCNTLKRSNQSTTYTIMIHETEEELYISLFIHRKLSCSWNMFVQWRCSVCTHISSVHQERKSQTQSDRMCRRNFSFSLSSTSSNL